MSSSPLSADATLRTRLHAAFLHPDDGKPFWWEASHVSTDIATRERSRLLDALRAAETVVGPPTMAGMLARREYEARNDPLMPPWLHRPWFVSSEVMLAVDALLERELGTGYSAVCGGSETRRAIADPRQWTEMSWLAFPVPGAIGDRDRKGVESTLPLALAAIGLPGTRITVWNEVEPARAFNGLLSGAVLREGYKRLGIPREYPDPIDIDNF